MNSEIEPVHVGEEEDIDVGSVENFEHEEIDYAIFRLESGFFATQWHCYCEDQTFLSEYVGRFTGPEGSTSSGADVTGKPKYAPKLTFSVLQ